MAEDYTPNLSHAREAYVAAGRDRNMPPDWNDREAARRAAAFNRLVESVRDEERERVLDVVEDAADMDDPRVGQRLAQDVRERLAREERDRG